MVLSSTRKAGKQLNPESEKWLKCNNENSRPENFYRLFFPTSKFKGKKWMIFSSNRIVPTETVAPSGTMGSKLHTSLKRQPEWFL